MAELQESVTGLHSIREVDEELKSWLLVQTAGDQQSMAKQPKTPSSALTERKGANNSRVEARNHKDQLEGEACP